VVSRESCVIVLYLTIAELLPATVVVLIMGGWSDASGRRKFLMWLPCVGSAVYAMGFLLPGYINGADIDRPVTMVIFVVASFLSGMSGSVPGFLSGNAGYISDTDSPRRRTLRLAFVEMSMGVTFGVASLINGFWIATTEEVADQTGSVHRPPPAFEQPLWFVVICSLVPFIIIYFLLREPASEPLLHEAGRTDNTLKGSIDGRPTSQIDSIFAEKHRCFRFCNFRGIQSAISLKTPAQRKLWAIVVAFQLYVFVQQGQERTLVLFLQNKPVGASPDHIGLQLFVLYVLAGIGSWPGVPLLQLVVNDLTIAAISMASKLAGSLITAVATNETLIYVGKYII
jgi:PCFT/HCP family folate transporter-like MFS transporter 1/3